MMWIVHALTSLYRRTARHRWRSEMKTQRDAAAAEADRLRRQRSADAPRAGSMVVQRVLAQQEGRSR